MKGCFTPLIGRFGNQIFQWAYAKAYSEQNGLELHTPRWAGEKIFQIEPTQEKQEGDEIIGGYRQNQASLIYTRKQVKEWLRLKPVIVERLDCFDTSRLTLCHLRHGDLTGYGYPAVSKNSYIKAASEVMPGIALYWSSEENPSKSEFFDKLGTPWLPDFYRLMTAQTLFRANSSFSYWAATLGNANVFSPIIDGLEGGREHDNVKFVAGNWPKLSEMVDCGDLRLKEE